jgi:DNA-binding NtrC family response regulator
MPRVRILVVDDEEGMLEVCAETLRQLPDTEVCCEQQSRRAAERLATDRFDLLIADVRMPELDGIQLLRIARTHHPDLAALMLTAYPTVETAVQSMKLGAADYVAKPFMPEELEAAVRRLLETRRLREENLLLSRHVERNYMFDELIGRSAAMQTVFDTIRRIAETDTDVLILGETGTGKELVARSIHGRSNRREGRFVPVDCGAIPEDLLESEFFGHERGAFTGAHARSLGLLEFADKGIFFLDEIGELPLRLQAKLLRVLQDRHIRRIGAQDEIAIDVRVIAAASRDLEEEMSQQRFRMDLYYRINVGRIVLPPLRERADDIPLLVDALVKRYAREMRREDVEVDPEVLEILSSYPWPGNVRELQNVIKRTLTMLREPIITAEDLPDDIVVRATGHPLGGQGGFFDLRDCRLAHFERDYLRNIMRSCRGNVPEAARQARLPRGTLYRLLKKHRMDPGEFRG